MGIRASSTCELQFDNLRVTPDMMLGEEGKGYKIAIEGLNEGRIGIGAQVSGLDFSTSVAGARVAPSAGWSEPRLNVRSMTARFPSNLSLACVFPQMLGLAQGAFDAAMPYIHQRKQFGQVIASYQGMQFSVASCATEIECARLMVYNAARLKEQGLPFVQQAAMAKLKASQVAEKVASQAVEWMGGIGFTKVRFFFSFSFLVSQCGCWTANGLAMCSSFISALFLTSPLVLRSAALFCFCFSLPPLLQECPNEKFFRDSKIGSIYEGTTNLQLQTIAKAISKQYQ